MEENVVKITSALYKILDFLPDNDPLKNKAKEKTLAILENVTLISQAQGWVSLQKEKASAQLLDDIGILENYLKIGKSLGWIDAMNFLIITKEYHKIKNNIIPPQGIIKQGMEVVYNFTRENKKEIAKEQTDINLAQHIDSKKNPEKQDLLSPKAQARQDKILKMLAEKEKAQVSDLIKEMPNITKRTVRRDLDDLLKRGEVVRVGEWNQVFYKISQIRES